MRKEATASIAPAALGCFLYRRKDMIPPIKSGSRTRITEKGIPDREERIEAMGFSMEEKREDRRYVGEV